MTHIPTTIGEIGDGMSELARMAQEAQHQYDAGETEEGGFAPEPAHNGNLDTHNDGHVEYANVLTLQGFVPGVTIERAQIWTEDALGLTPSQALSLLEWLQQEKPKLEQMAKEQGETV